MPRTSIDKEFKAQLGRARSLEEIHLFCRLGRHAWERVESDREPEFGRMLCFECIRCTSRRYDTVDPRYGNLLQRNYGYAEGYMLSKPADGSRVMSIEALRVEMVRRIDRAG